MKGRGDFYVYEDTIFLCGDDMSGDSAHKKIVIAIALLTICVALLDVYVFDALRSENNALKDQVSKLQNELNETRRELETLKVSVGDQRIELLNLLSSYNDNFSRILSSLNNNINIITQKVSSIEEGQKSLATRVLNLEQNEASLTIDLSKINRAVKDILSENQQLNNKITSLEDRIEKIETPTYTYIGAYWETKDFITAETFTGKTKIKIQYLFRGSAWDSWCSIWLTQPDGTPIRPLTATSGYYSYETIEAYIPEEEFRLTVFVRNGEIMMNLFT